MRYQRGEPTGKCDRPMAGPGFKSYRYRGRYGWIMIGARDTMDALNEAYRSTGVNSAIANLQIWNGTEYVDII
ncbi:MAG: hypothetical protein JWN75_1184 [Candidatus Saccharibacteria bacterium]|nr:hypothetical protein [Candidatus Saccharibacteria bacterium]